MTKIIFRGQCSESGKCKNDLCFFRQRDVFGRPAFPEPLDTAKAKEVEEEHGPPIFPILVAEIGTNEIVVMCDSYIP